MRFRKKPKWAYKPVCSVSWAGKGCELLKRNHQCKHQSRHWGRHWGLHRCYCGQAS